MTKKDCQKIKKITEDFLQKMGIDHQLIIEEKSEVIYLNIETTDPALLIGWHGETLISIEYILKIITQKKFGFGKTPKFILDIGGYRKDQTERLEKMAQKTTQKVLKYKRPEVLRPMNAYERRVVHLILQKTKEITTESIGQEPNRRVIIRLK